MSSLTDLMRLFSDVPISLFNAASIQYLKTFVVSIQLVLLHCLAILFYIRVSEVCLLKFELVSRRYLC